MTPYVIHFDRQTLAVTRVRKGDLQRERAGEGQVRCTTRDSEAEAREWFRSVVEALARIKSGR